MADTHTDTATDTATDTGSRPADGRAATTTTNAYLRRDRRDRMVYRLRHQLAPHLLLAGVWVTGAAGWLAGGWAGDRGLVATGLLSAVAAAGAVRWLTACRRGAAVTGRQAAGAAAATGWLGWATMAGPGWTATAVLLAGGYAASLRWWRRWRLPDPGEDPQPPAGPDPMHPPRLWADHIAHGGPLPGSYLTGEHQIATGLR
jgi:hypothetical protein